MSKYLESPFLLSSDKYDLLKKFYEGEKEIPFLIFPEFCEDAKKKESSLEDSSEEKRKEISSLSKKKGENSSLERIKREVLSIQDLSNLAKNPIKFYLQNALQIYFPSAQEKGHEFILSALDKGLLMVLFLERVIFRSSKKSGRNRAFTRRAISRYSHKKVKGRYPANRANFQATPYRKRGSFYRSFSRRRGKKTPQE